MNKERAKAIIRKEYLCVYRDCDIEKSCGRYDLMMPSKEPILQAYKMAIQALEQEPYDDAKYHEEHGEVIVDKAVWEDAKRALEQEPCDHPDKCYECKKILTCDYYKQEPSGDAVSREDVINLKWQGEASEEFLEGYASAIEDARVLPSVNPQEKMGHWIYKPKTDLSICDKCGSYCPQDKFGRIETDFCPKCGARMVEPTCDTCEYSTAAFNPCNACKDKSEYKPLERSE